MGSTFIVLVKYLRLFLDFPIKKQEVQPQSYFCSCEILSTEMFMAEKSIFGTQYSLRQKRPRIEMANCTRNISTFRRLGGELLSDIKLIKDREKFLKKRLTRIPLLPLLLHAHDFPYG